MIKLVFATNNKHKLEEIEACIDKKIHLLSLSGIGVNHDIPENEPTLEGNALSKARFVWNTCRCNVFADDTGLEVPSLDNNPGVHSARYAGETKDPEANMEKLLANLGPGMSREARFRTVIALIYDNMEYLFEGIIPGRISTEKRGDGGFGYDPLFIPDGYDKTFAEMSPDEKNAISHRAIAINRLNSFLKTR